MVDYTRDFFRLRIADGTWYGFRVSFQDADPHGEQKLMSISRNVEGRMVTVEAALVRPRTFLGLLRVSPLDERQAVDEPDAGGPAHYGNLADLRACYHADRLEVQAWNDATTWPAKWVGLYAPKNLDLKGVWFAVPCQLEQIE